MKGIKMTHIWVDLRVSWIHGLRSFGRFYPLYWKRRGMSRRRPRTMWKRWQKRWARWTSILIQATHVLQRLLHRSTSILIFPIPWWKSQLCIWVMFFSLIGPACNLVFNYQASLVFQPQVQSSLVWKESKDQRIPCHPSIVSWRQLLLPMPQSLAFVAWRHMMHSSVHCTLFLTWVINLNLNLVMLLVWSLPMMNPLLKNCSMSLHHLRLKLMKHFTLWRVIVSCHTHTCQNYPCISWFSFWLHDNW